jgi:hypothetical protein
LVGFILIAILAFSSTCVIRAQATDERGLFIPPNKNPVLPFGKTGFFIMIALAYE